MKIGIISDTHDHLANTRLALKKLETAGCEVLIHCGDFCSPFMMKELGFFSGEVHCCFGNTDDRFSTTKIALTSGVHLAGDVGEIELSGKRIAFVHFPIFARGLASTGDYDLVFYGHSHMSKIETIGETLLINPGECAGIKADPTYAIYDTESNTAEIFSLKE